ncbi:2Fe-2S iron-sulfur cluster-binding protein [soil metagenome]
MTTLVATTREGHSSQIAGTDGRSIMEILRDNGVDEILALCGGACSCATCHVYIDDAHLEAFPAMTDFESELLDCSSHRQANSRLSCQLRWSPALEGLQVTVAPED